VKNIKKKALIFLLLISPLGPLLAQPAYKLSGHITDCKTKTGIENATIRLVGNNKSDHTVISDNKGFYFFQDSLLTPETDFVLMCDAPTNGPKTRTFGKCPYSPCYTEVAYFNSHNKIKFSTDKSIDKRLIHDFCLVEARGCGWSIPDIYFSENSSEFSTNRIENPYGTSYAADTAIDCIVGLMKCNPRYTFEIRGHADNKETNARALSEQRVQKIYSILIEKGIDKDRLHTKSYGSERSVEQMNEYGQSIGKHKGPLNQRVDLTILSKDFDTAKGEGTKD
jgi:hypothetical protein